MDDCYDKINKNHKNIDLKSIKTKIRILLSELGEISYHNRIRKSSIDYIYFKINDLMYDRKVIIQNIHIINNAKGNPRRFFFFIFGFIIILAILIIALMLIK